MATGGLTGILLVGGASRRFGSPKALARFEGETLAERAWGLLAVVCDERIAVGKTADRLAVPFDVVDDDSNVRAPIAGLVAGLRVATNEASVVLPVDMPLLDEATLVALAREGGDAAIPQSGPLPGVYRKAALPALEGRLAAGDLGLQDALQDLDTRRVTIDPSLLANVNEPKDLLELELPIVPFDREHGDAWRRLVSETLREFGFQADPELDPDLADPGCAYVRLWVALSHGSLVGSVALRDLGEGRLELKRMYVSPEARGRGLGRRLLETALGWARAQGAERVVLDTTQEMAAARHLYEASGFRRVAGDAPRQGQARLLYELVL